MAYEWPQFTMMALYGIGIGLALANHGKPKKEKHNAFFTLIGVAFSIFLLRSGGFF